MNPLADLAVFAHARAHTYRFLASVFLAPPNAEFLARVRCEEFRAAFGSWVEPRDWDCITQSAQATLEVEYNRLFVVPGTSYVSPYESVYTDVVDVEYSPHMVSGAGDLPTQASKLLFGPSTTAVKHAYADAGFALEQGAPELPDHLGVELQFLARLCDEQSVACAAENISQVTRFQKIEEEFLRAHPLRWINLLQERMDKVNAHPFYCSMARLCETFLQSSASLLSESAV